VEHSSKFSKECGEGGYRGHRIGGLGNIYSVACILKFAEAVAVHALALLVDGGVQLELNRVSFF
jgi:hypothetical protein